MEGQKNGRVAEAPTKVAAQAVRQSLGISNAADPGGADLGNGFIKLVTTAGRISMPSCFYPTSARIKELPDTQLGGLLEYEEGSDETLKGKRWFFGEGAVIMANGRHTSVVDKPDGKLLYGLRVLLGAVALLYPNASKVSLNLHVSVDDAGTHRASLHTALTGVHFLKVNDERNLTVNIGVNKVLDEGMGCGVMLRLNKKVKAGEEGALVDFGRGTTIISQMSGGRVTNRKNISIGVDNLYVQICENEELKKRLRGKEGQLHLVQKALHTGDLKYGLGSRAFSIADIYQQEAVAWTRDLLVKIQKQLVSWDSPDVFATGGGCLLPSIGTFLEKQGIWVVDEPVWSNANGLFNLAKML